MGSSVGESGAADSSLGAQAMPKPYSDDLRERVIEAVEAGASRREAAESFNLCPSSAVKWLQRWRDTGSARRKILLWPVIQRFVNIRGEDDQIRGRQRYYRAVRGGGPQDLKGDAARRTRPILDHDRRGIALHF